MHRVTLAAILWTVLLTVAALSPGLADFNGDTYSAEAQIGAIIDDIFKCFGVHQQGVDDNTVLFDGLSEFLDPYLDGNMPLVFEFETGAFQSKAGTGTSTTNIVFLGDSDLFPEGFEDPETGTPLTAACVEIGIDDTLDSAEPVTVAQATIEAMSGNMTVIPEIDITPVFSDPWDGRLSLVLPGFTGKDIDDITLRLETIPNPQPIFADGFESGDATAWR